MTPASTGGEISALDGSLTVAAATGCGPTSATYAVTGRVGEPGDQIGVLAGTWTLVDDLPECTGEGCSFGALAMTLVVECSGAVCTVRLDGGVASALVSADTISVTGITQEAFGSLPDGRGLACDGVAIGTDFGLSLAPQLDGQGRITGSLRLSVDPGGPCSDASYAASFVGIPA